MLKTDDIESRYKQERKAAFVEEISRFVQERKRTEAFTREQLGKLDGLGRLQAQRQSLLDNMAHYYAKHRNADAAPGVLALITIYSDNHEGACELSIERMAVFLSRSERAIREAAHRLDEDQVILVERRNTGLDDAYLRTPWVHKSFGAIRDPLTWILDVRAPRSEIGNRGGRHDNHRKPASPGFGEQPPEASFPWLGEPPEAGRTNHRKPASPYTTKSNTTAGGIAGYACATGVFSDDQLDELNRLYNTWGTKPGAIILATVDRQSTDKQIAGEVDVGRSQCEEHPSLLRTACLATYQSLVQRERTATGRNGGLSMLKLFRSILADEIGRVRLNAVKLQAEAASEREYQERRHDNRLKAIEDRTTTRKTHGRESIEDIAAKAWGSK